MPWIDVINGEIKQAQIFVGCLGASQYTFVEATESQQLPDWIDSHVHMFEYFQGVTEIVVPDNLKSGVHKAHLYDPDINQNYQELGKHYGFAIVPARAAEPKDKAKAENVVGCITRQIMAPFRDYTFTSVAEINEVFAPCLDKFNAQRFQKMKTSRRELYEALDKPVLKSLPLERYQYAEWTPERMRRWAAKIGPKTAGFIEQMILSRPFPQQAYRACLGLLRLGEKYGDVRLEQACAKGLLAGLTRYQQIDSMLVNKFETVPLAGPSVSLLPKHDNIRGPKYYE